MPKYTSHYKLAAFLGSDAYSASLDKSRFSIIDNQTSFISDVIGDGVVEGWSISDSSSGGDLSIAVSYGLGVINRRISQSFFDIEKEVDPDSIFYVYVKNKNGEFPVFGPFSSYASFEWSDITPPAVPTGLTCSDITSSSINLSWDENSEDDFYEYILERSTDNITFSEISRSSVASYRDISLLENTIYYYRISAIDTSGNQSFFSSIVSATTLWDYSVPNSPNYFIYLPGNNQIQAIFDIDDVSKIENFKITIQPLDYEHNIYGPQDIYTLNNSERDFVIEDLTNFQEYKVELYSVSYAGTESEKISLVATPKSNSGPDEVSNLVGTYEVSTQNTFFGSLNIYWTQGEDAYAPVPEKYIVNIIENGNKVYDPLIFFTNNIYIDTLFYRGACSPILSSTYYIVKVQAVDNDGVYNNGVAIIIKTESAKNPSSPSSVKIELLDDFLLFSWENSISEFENNILTIEAKDLETDQSTSVVNSEFLGKTNSYSIPKEDLLPNNQYSLKIKCIDKFGKYSEEKEEFYILPALYAGIERPPASSAVYAFGGDNQILVVWEPVNEEYTSVYNIWRAPHKQFAAYSSSDFEMLAEIEPSILSFTDRNVENSNSYMYMVTTTDKFGNSSLNPTEDDYFFHPSYSAKATRKNDGFGIPYSVSISNPSGSDLVITWDNSDADNFDGFEIYRSLDNVSWAKIGAVDSEIKTFTDENVLSNGSYTYYYIVREVRNEIDIVLEDALLEGDGSILLAKITSGDSSVEILDLSKQLGSLESLIEEKNEIIIAGHKHILDNFSDKRIDLASNIIITDWSTEDSRTFITSVPMMTLVFEDGQAIDIIKASDYVVRVDGEIYSGSYSINEFERKIIFDSKISLSSLEVECIGLEETDGEMSSDRIEQVSATKIGFGFLPKCSLPPIQHDGFIKRELIPLQKPMVSDDFYEFTIYQNTLDDYFSSIGQSYAFYDMLQIGSSNIFIAATSNGVMISRNYGREWYNLFETEGAVHKIYFASNTGKYIILCNKKAYISSDGLGWNLLNGLDNVSIIRDVLEVQDNIFFSTDKGVFALKNDDYGKFFICQHLSLYSGETSDTYAIWHNDYNSALYASSDMGIFESLDSGETWFFTEEIEEYSAFWKVIEDEENNVFFAVSDNAIWRKEKESYYFEKIAILDVEKCRNILIFEDRLLVSTSKGLFVSDDSSNIFIDNSVLFSSDCLYALQPYRPKISPIYFVREMNGFLYFGTEQKIFIATALDNISILYENQNGIIPTFYIDGKEQILGVFYDINDDSVYFDTKILVHNQVSVANQYKVFTDNLGGWINKKYNADVKIYNKNELICTLSNSIVPIEQFSNVEFDIFTENNSNSLEALKNQQYYNSLLADLVNANGDESSRTSSYFSEYVQTTSEQLVYFYKKAYSNFLGKNKYATLRDIDLLSYLVVDNIMVPYSLASAYFSGYNIIENIPELSASSEENTNYWANISDGTVETSINRNRFSPLYIDIEGGSLIGFGVYTHKKIEDSLMLFDSGLTFSLSEVFQTNLVKMEMLLDRKLGI